MIYTRRPEQEHRALYQEEIETSQDGPDVSASNGRRLVHIAGNETWQSLTARPPAGYLACRNSFFCSSTRKRALKSGERVTRSGRRAGLKATKVPQTSVGFNLDGLGNGGFAGKPCSQPVGEAPSSLNAVLAVDPLDHRHMLPSIPFLLLQGEMGVERRRKFGRHGRMPRTTTRSSARVLGAVNKSRISHRTVGLDRFAQEEQLMYLACSHCNMYHSQRDFVRSTRTAFNHWSSELG